MATFLGGHWIHWLLIKPLYNIHLLTRATFFCVCGEQSAKKVVSKNTGLVDFAIGLIISILNLPYGQMKFFGEIQITEEL